MTTLLSELTNVFFPQNGLPKLFWQIIQIHLFQRSRKGLSLSLFTNVFFLVLWDSSILILKQQDLSGFMSEPVVFFSVSDVWGIRPPGAFNSLDKHIWRCGSRIFRPRGHTAVAVFVVIVLSQSLADRSWLYSFSFLELGWLHDPIVAKGPDPESKSFTPWVRNSHCPQGTLLLLDARPHLILGPVQFLAELSQKTFHFLFLKPVFGKNCKTPKF